MSEKPIVKHEVKISIRVRMFFVLTVIYVVTFVGTHRLLVNAMPGILVTAVQGQNVSADTLITVSASVVSQIDATFLSFFIVGYAVFLVGFIIMSWGISRPLRTLTRYAQRVESGDYTQAQIPNLWLKDEVSVLAEVFESMVSSVREREDMLKKQITEMQIVIDETKRKRDVEEITNSEFFNNLKDQAKKLRKTGESTAETEAS